MPPRFPPLLIALAALAILPRAFAETPAHEFTLEDFRFAPVRVHLLKAPAQPAFCTTLTEADIERIVTKVNRVWAQAGLGFYVESVVSEEPAPVAEPELAPALDLRALLALIPKASYQPELFNLYYVKSFGVNGVRFPEAIFVKDTAALRRVEGGIDEPLPRVTSHELGHALGLPHRQATFNLMASGTTGTTLNAEEIEHARGVAQALGTFISGPELLIRADALAKAGHAAAAAELYRRLAAVPLEDALLVRIREHLAAPAAEN